MINRVLIQNIRYTDKNKKREGGGASKFYQLFTTKLMIKCQPLSKEEAVALMSICQPDFILMTCAYTSCLPCLNINGTQISPYLLLTLSELSTLREERIL